VSHQLAPISESLSFEGPGNMTLGRLATTSGPFSYFLVTNVTKRVFSNIRLLKIVAGGPALAPGTLVARSYFMHFSEGPGIHLHLQVSAMWPEALKTSDSLIFQITICQCSLFTC